MTREGKAKRANEKQRAHPATTMIDSTFCFWRTVAFCVYASFSLHACMQTHTHVAVYLKHCPHIRATQGMVHYKSVSPAIIKVFWTEAIKKTSDPKAGLRLTTLVLLRVEINDILLVLFLISLESSSFYELWSIWEPDVVQFDCPICTTNTTSMTTWTTLLQVLSFLKKLPKNKLGPEFPIHLISIFKCKNFLFLQITH